MKLLPVALILSFVLILTSTCSYAADPLKLIFSKGDLSTGGTGIELSLTKNQNNNLYSAMLRNAFVDMQGTPTEEAQVLGSDLSCAFTVVNTAITATTCSSDSRPVDGILNEVILVQSPLGTFTATQHTAYFNRLTHQPVDQVDEIASDLSLVP